MMEGFVATRPRVHELIVLGGAASPRSTRRRSASPDHLGTTGASGIVVAGGVQIRDGEAEPLVLHERDDVRRVVEVVGGRRAWNDARALARTEPRRGPGRPRNNSAPPPAHERVRKLKGARYALWNYAEQLIMPSRRRDALPDKGSRLGNSA